jgi:hypothetical protein
MTSVRGSALVFLLAFAGVVAASSMSRADVIGTCSCRSATCHGRWELKGANTAALPRGMPREGGRSRLPVEGASVELSLRPECGRDL